MAHGKKIEIFIPDPATSILTSIKLMGWSGSGVKIARAEIKNCLDFEITKPGVYFLFCENDDGDKAVYIGESNNVRDRLLQHIKEYDKGTESYYWGNAVIFVGADMHKTLIQYIEHCLVKLAVDCHQYKMLTKVTFDVPISPADKAVCEEYIDNVKMLIGLLGYNVFESATKLQSHDTKMLYCSNKDGADASGYFGLRGFVVKEGSKVSNSIAEHMKKHSTSYYALRNQLEENGIIINHTFVIDYEFASPSAASSVVLGRSSNGRIDWKMDGNPDGRETLFKGLLYLTDRGSNAIGHINDDHSFVVHKGSCITPWEPTDSCPTKAKNDLEENQSKINQGRLIEDIVFKSPSGASNFVLQASSDGWARWHDEHGVYLKNLIEKHPV